MYCNIKTINKVFFYLCVKIASFWEVVEESRNSRKAKIGSVSKATTVWQSELLLSLELPNKIRALIQKEH